MTTPSSPVAVVEAQLDAYNARDLDAFCALYANDVVLERLDEPSRPVVRGMDAFRLVYAARFADSPRLHCAIRGRIVLGPYVVDHESVTGIDDALVEAIAIYEVRDGTIRSLRILKP